MDNKILVSSEIYMRIIAGKAVKYLPLEPKLDNKYKIVNETTKTFMTRDLYAILGDYSYWKK